MKRHESLHALSQHHHFALIQALQIRLAREQPAARRAAALRKVAAEFVRFWEKTGREHFREEEEILLPAYARHASLAEDRDVVRMLADHAEIRALISEIREALSAGEVPGEKVAALGRRLYDHVRLEEDRIFPRFEKTLPEAELRALEKHFTRLHPKRACAI
jgi:hemerythrin-like domain-containing protein